VAQPGRALGSGPRGRWFESSRPDHHSNPRQANFLGNPAVHFSHRRFSSSLLRPSVIDRVPGASSPVLLHHHERFRTPLSRRGRSGSGFRTTLTATRRCAFSRLRRSPGGPSKSESCRDAFIFTLPLTFDYHRSSESRSRTGDQREASDRIHLQDGPIPGRRAARLWHSQRRRVSARVSDQRSEQQPLAARLEATRGGGHLSAAGA
jgi:hypothetical protein